MTGSGMPQMRTAMNGWNRRMTLVRRQQKIVNGEVRDVDVPFAFRGMIQPLSPKEIELKPDGERAWEWVQIHARTTEANQLTTNDRILYFGKVYKIMGVKDYSLNGYVEYHAIRDYQGLAGTK